VQNWPRVTFAQLRGRLTGNPYQCSCDVVFPNGAATGLDGKPTPAVYAFIRMVSGWPRLGTLTAYADDELIPHSEVRSLCAALDLDVDAILRHFH